MTVSAPSVTESAILMEIRAFLLAILPSGVEVLRGQPNFVPEPASPDFVIMTHMGRDRLATNSWTWDHANPATALLIDHSTQSDVQLDIHGPNSTDNSQIITTLWRDEFACDVIDKSICTPLDATDGKQMPFVNGESLYEDRWVVTLTLQSNLFISTGAQFADILTPNTSPVGS